MCGIFTCLQIVPWILDVVQRILTLGLAMCIGLVVCLSLLIALSAGLAYGYNYSMSEFLSLSRDDVSVYIKRGPSSTTSIPENTTASSPSSPGLRQLPHLSSPELVPDLSMSNELEEQDSSNYPQNLDDSTQKYESLSKVSNKLYKPKEFSLASNDNDLWNSEIDIQNQDEVIIENTLQKIVKEYQKKKQSSSKPLEQFIRFIQTSTVGNVSRPSRSTTPLYQNLPEKKPSTKEFIRFITTNNIKEYIEKHLKHTKNLADDTAVSATYRGGDIFWVKYS